MNNITVTSKFTLFRSLALIAFFDIILIRIMTIVPHPAIYVTVMLCLIASLALAMTYITRSFRTWSTLPLVSTEENVIKMVVFGSLGMIALIAFPEQIITYLVLVLVTVYRAFIEILE